MKTSRPDWARLARLDLRAAIAVAAEIPALRRLGPPLPWSAEIELIGTPAMTRLNAKYRGKRRPTDVLSFEAPEVFRASGMLGELVICMPVLKAQAKELGHTPRHELRVLMAHGLLHLLGLDHDRSAAEARKMAALEARLLGGPAKGLIGRSR